MRILQLTFLALATLIGVAGCVSSPPQHFYQLQTAAAERSAKDSGPAILLGPLTVADYLDRDVVVQRAPDGSLTVDPALRWAGSLKDDIAQVLLRQLAARLGTSRIAVYPDRVGFEPEVQVRLNITRLDAGPDQPAVLEAQWRLLDGNGDLHNSKVVRLEQAHDGSVADQVQAQGELLRQLAEQLAQAIRPMVQDAAAQRSALEGGRQAVRDSAVLPVLPAVPTAHGTEVFRF